jgi:hypothetical protein
MKAALAAGISRRRWRRRRQHMHALILVATILVRHCRSCAGCGSSRKRKSFFAAPAARSDHPGPRCQTHIAVFAGHIACRMSWLWCSDLGLSSRTSQPPHTTNTRRVSICNSNARCAVVVGGCGVCKVYAYTSLRCRSHARSPGRRSAQKRRPCPPAKSRKPTDPPITT